MVYPIGKSFHVIHVPSAVLQSDFPVKDGGLTVPL